VAWWTAQRCVNAAAVVLPDVDRLHVKQLGIDEHRYRRARWFRDPDTSAWRRVEPWMTTLVNVASGQVLGVVDGRDSAAVEAWLGHRSQAWRDRIQIVAIDPSATFKKARPESPPHPERFKPAAGVTDPAHNTLH
jgi:transposase